MILLVDIVEINNKLGNGSTHPYVVWCNDGNKYVAKFPGNPEREKSLVNEFICSKLCSYLELPIMPYELINVRLDNYKQEMLEDDILLLEGTAFGTIYDDRLVLVLNSDSIKKTMNHNDAVKILIFDLLIGNNDRNRGNLMINSNSKELIMIDHTHIFNIGVVWDEWQLARLETEPFDTSRLNRFNYVNLINSFVFNSAFYNELDDFIDKVKSITEEIVEIFLEDLPEDWNISSNEKKAIVSFVVNRFHRVDEVLELLNLRGGDSSE